MFMFPNWRLFAGLSGHSRDLSRSFKNKLSGIMFGLARPKFFMLYIYVYLYGLWDMMSTDKMTTKTDKMSKKFGFFFCLNIEFFFK